MSAGRTSAGSFMYAKQDSRFCTATSRHRHYTVYFKIFGTATKRIRVSTNRCT